MSDLFGDKNISPMLLYQVEPFDDENYIYELKLDGIRCLAYLDANTTTLRNKRNKDVTDIYPELSRIHKCAKKKCILDGELVIFKDGKPDFYSLQSRSLKSDPFKIKLAANKLPVQFVAYDMIYVDGERITDKSLMERKKLMTENLSESGALSISRYIEKEGIAFFEIAKEQGLEGIVAKKKDGKYYIGKRTREWVKIKVMQDEDLLVCGYQPDADGNVKDLVLGYYDGNKLKTHGKVFLGVSKQEREIIKNYAESHTLSKALFDEYKEKDIIWIKPELVGTVQYMHTTETGNMRQPVWKGLKMEKHR